MKPKKVIVLWGNGNCGKTATIRILVDMLIKKGGVIIKGNIPPNKEEDITAVIEWKRKKIGICSSGDTRDCQEKGYAKLGKNCDIYVFVSRTKGATVKFVFDSFNSCPIIWHEKWSVLKDRFDRKMSSQIQKEVNLIQAQKIVETI